MRKYGAIRWSATGRAAAAACSGSRHPPASRGQVILDDLGHHHLARVAFPSGPRWCGRSPARHRCRPPPGCGRPARTPGRTSPPGGAGGQVGRRAVQPVAHGGLLAGKLAPGVRADAGQGRQRSLSRGAGSWAPIRPVLAATGQDRWTAVWICFGVGVHFFPWPRRRTTGVAAAGGVAAGRGAAAAGSGAGIGDGPSRDTGAGAGMSLPPRRRYLPDRRRAPADANEPTSATGARRRTAGQRQGTCAARRSQ